MGYWETVETIAEEALAEYPDDESSQSEYVSESVDGSSYTIYYSGNEEVLNTSPNEPDGDEVSAMCAPDADWRKMRTVAAFMAMEQDVLEKVEELREAAEDDEDDDDES